MKYNEVLYRRESTHSEPRFGESDEHNIMESARELSGITPHRFTMEGHANGHRVYRVEVRPEVHVFAMPRQKRLLWGGLIGDIIDLESRIEELES